jgi:queuine tRNA-ribosyltransferase
VAAAFAFEILATSGRARRGRLSLAHGSVETPAFMPVGTRGAVKAITMAQLADLGAEILLANAYHLHVRPGDEAIAAAGGLHAFVNWPRPILTDSGGYQVFSLAGRRTISEDAVVFQSHLDGSAKRFTPESATDIQARLGSDIAMVFDECTPWPIAHDEAASAMRRTLRWARRARDRFDQLAAGGAPEVPRATPGQAQFGIIQGSTYKDLRDESVAGTLAVGFEAYAIGGLSVGEPPEVLHDIAGHVADQLPAGRPRYLMGAGKPEDLLEAVSRGIDMFDCVLPTRNARNGQLFTRRGPISIKNARYADDVSPADPECACPTCRSHSLAYLRHLFVSGEMTSGILNTVHNLHFYLDTMGRIRKAIEFGIFEEFKREFLTTYSRQPSDA